MLQRHIKLHQELKLVKDYLFRHRKRKRCLLRSYHCSIWFHYIYCSHSLKGKEEQRKIYMFLKLLSFLIYISSHSDSLLSEDESVEFALFNYGLLFSSGKLDSVIAFYPSLFDFLSLNSFKHCLYRASPFSTNLARKAETSVRSYAISLWIFVKELLKNCFAKVKDKLSFEITATDACLKDV